MADRNLGAVCAEASCDATTPNVSRGTSREMGDISGEHLMETYGNHEFALQYLQRNIPNSQYQYEDPEPLGRGNNQQIWRKQLIPSVA